MDCFERPNKKKYLTDAQKARIVSLRNDGHRKLADIARLADTTISTVRKWIQKYNQDRNIERKRIPGRPRIITSQQNNEMVEYLKKNPFSTAIRAAALQNVPYRTALRRIHENGLGNFVAAHETKLTEAHKTARMNYCRYMLNVFKEENFQKIIFTDEKTFRSDESHSVRVYRPKGKRYEREFICEDRLSGHLSASYWGWISCAGPGEIIATGTHFKSESYVEMLDTVAFPSIEAQFGSINDIVFMQDNARIHTARIVTEYLRSKQVVVLPHPALSPDLNPIEIIWSVLERDRPKLIERTYDGLNTHVFNRWEDLRRRHGKYFTTRAKIKLILIRMFSFDFRFI